MGKRGRWVRELSAWALEPSTTSRQLGSRKKDMTGIPHMRACRYSMGIWVSYWMPRRSIQRNKKKTRRGWKKLFSSSRATLNERGGESRGAGVEVDKCFSNLFFSPLQSRAGRVHTLKDTTLTFPTQKCNVFWKKIFGESFSSRRPFSSSPLAKISLPFGCEVVELPLKTHLRKT